VAPDFGLPVVRGLFQLSNARNQNTVRALSPNLAVPETGAVFLFALLKKLNEEIEPSAKQVETALGVHPAKARRIAANIAKLPGLLLNRQA
jgi:hypothetical protein